MSKKMNFLRRAGALAFLGMGALGAPALHAQTAAPAAPVQWTAVDIELPVGDALFPQGEGAQTANGYCLMCHSTDMVLAQPPLTQAQWLGEIEKMRKFFGAPIPADQDAALARYLTGISQSAAGK